MYDKYQDIAQYFFFLKKYGIYHDDGGNNFLYKVRSFFQTS
jgi:hypothetical protein